MKAVLKSASGLAVLSASIMLAGCEGSSSYRVASVGDGAAAATAQEGDPSSTDAAGDNTAGGTNGDGSGAGGASGAGAGGTGSGAGAGSGTGSGSGSGSQTGSSAAGGKVLVTAGNVVLGVAQKQSAVTNKTTALAPVTAPVTGKVTRLLTRTGQSLVDIGNGRTVLVGGAGNAIGRVVSLGIANRSLVGVSSGQSLVGVNLLSRTPVTGSLVTAGALSGNSLAVVDVTKPSAASALTAVTPAASAILPSAVTGALPTSSLPSAVTGALPTTATSLPSVVTGALPTGAALPTGTALPTGLTGSLTGSAATSQTGVLPATQATVKKVIKLGGN